MTEIINSLYGTFLGIAVLVVGFYAAEIMHIITDKMTGE